MKQRYALSECEIYQPTKTKQTHNIISNTKRKKL